MKPSQAIENAARILREAEVSTDREYMGRLDDLARTWVQIATLLCEHEDARQ